MTRLSQSILVGAAPEQVWPLLIEPRTWQTWWRGVNHARTSDLRPLREGSRAEVTVDLGLFKHDLRALVHLCSDGKLLSARGRLLGVRCAWSWYLHRTERGCRTELQCDIGAPQILLRWTRLGTAWSASTARTLRQLKALAERL